MSTSSRRRNGAELFRPYLTSIWSPYKQAGNRLTLNSLVFSLKYRGTAVACVVGQNVERYSDQFDNCVRMYVFEEIVNGRKLSHIINEEHENVKYLPGYKLPDTVVCNI